MDTVLISDKRSHLTWLFCTAVLVSINRIIGDKRKYIKEPKGVDFLRQSEPLTDKARQEASEFIRNYKLKATCKSEKKQSTASKSKQTA